MGHPAPTRRTRRVINDGGFVKNFRLAKINILENQKIFFPDYFCSEFFYKVPYSAANIPEILLKRFSKKKFFPIFFFFFFLQRIFFTKDFFLQIIFLRNILEKSLNVF